MPIIEYENYIEITGDEFNQLDLLHKNIEAGKSIQETLDSIDPKHRLLLLDFRIGYWTLGGYKDGCSAVHVAAKYGNLNALIQLANAGADLHLFTNRYGLSALHVAAQFNQVAIIDYLIVQKNFSSNLPRKLTNWYASNVTPLFESASSCAFQAAERLLHYKADINYQDMKGETPMLYLMNYGFFRFSDEAVFNMIKLFLKKGAAQSAESILCENDLKKFHEKTYAESLHSYGRFSLFWQAAKTVAKNKLSTENIPNHVSKVITEARNYV